MPFSESRIGELRLMVSSNITTTHAFTTRYGGVSSGIYTSLNLGQNLGDDPASVRQNYEILGAALGFDPSGLVMSRQVHGADVRLVSSDDKLPPFQPIPYEADGLITAEKGVPLIIFSADCVPILLFDPVGSAIGAVHAGWRGTTKDIAGEAVRKMSGSLGCTPSDIHAAIGPCISACCFETGDDVKTALAHTLGRDAARFIVTHKTVANGEKHMIDLKGINSLLLERAGIRPENIEISPDCTSCLNDKYWSHRATNGQRGSQISVIMMKGYMN